MPRAQEPAEPRTTVVIATRDRRRELLQTLERLTALPERPPIIVVDNGSTDGTATAVREAFPGVRLERLPTNIGAPARNHGADLASTELVAFADDDSWWAPGALTRAADVFSRHPRLAVLQARILVGPEERTDPVCDEMARSPLPPLGDLPGPPVLGFVACGAVVRRRPFLAAGGFDDILFFLGEEELVAQDLAAAGWGLAYVEDVVAHHHPSPVRDATARRQREVRNDLLTAWMRRSWRVVAARTARAGVRAVRDPVSRAAVAEALVRAPAALRRRRTLPSELERRVRLLERSRHAAVA